MYPFSYLLPVLPINSHHLERYKSFIISRCFRYRQNNSPIELHHIIPRGIGGEDSEENLIYLTLREHYIAHLLLWKCGYTGMQSAFWLMVHTRENVPVLSSRKFESLKKDFTLYKSNITKGERNPRYGKSWKENKSEEEIARINKSKGRKGKDNKRYGVKLSEDERLIIVEHHSKLSGKYHPLYGIKFSESHKKSLSRAMSGKNNKKAKRVKCLETGEIFDYMGQGAEVAYGKKMYKSYIRRSIKENKPIKGFSWQDMEESA